jgi:hypothetical protein
MLRKITIGCAVVVAVLAAPVMSAPIALAPTPSNWSQCRQRWRTASVGAESERSDENERSDGVET